MLSSYTCIILKFVGCFERIFLFVASAFSLLVFLPYASQVISTNYEAAKSFIYTIKVTKHNRRKLSNAV